MSKNTQTRCKCQICQKEHALSDLFYAELVRPSISDFIKLSNPNWSAKGYICLSDLRKYRADYVKHIILQDRGELTELDQMVCDSLKEHELITKNINKAFEKQLSFGARMADKVAHFGGSWTFIIIFFSFLILWMGVNSIFIIRNPLDPFPYIFLNLMLSCLAAIQAPVIMMSQNRQAEKDRMRSDDDYLTNLKSELEIRQLHSKLDQFMKKQWDRILELQGIQIELAEDLLKKKYKHKLNSEDTKVNDQQI